MTGRQNNKLIGANALCNNVLRVAMLLLVVFVSTACSDPEVRYVRKAVRIMDRNALYAQGDEWQHAKDEALAARPANHDEALEVVRTAAAIAGGKHTFLLTVEDFVEQEAVPAEMPSVEVNADGVAIIVMPHFQGSGEEAKAYCKQVLDALPDTLTGAVLDLRGNTGGNMYPMIVAVHRLLPDDELLSFRTRKYTRPIKRSYCLRNEGITAQAPLQCPVALLTDSLTASSGEALLLCFRGLDYARVFGTPTAGYASSNRPFTLSDGAQLVLTTGSDVARTGEVFCDDPIQPDVLTDNPMAAALEWLASLR